MAVSLIKHKRIFTTLAKAKELRKYIEPLITKCKDDTTHSRRIVFRNLRDKYAVTELFKDISKKIGDRPGGYTRIIKTGNRLGDNASMCFIELVDYNELMLKDIKAPLKTKTRRSKRKTDDNVSKDAPKATTVRKTATENKTVEIPQAPVIEEKSETPVVEAPAEETSITEIPAEETPAAGTSTPAETIPEEELAGETPKEETSETEDAPKEE
jgi:large subunit ribosomal protein L17